MGLYLGENLISGTQIVTDKSERIGQIITSTIPLTDAGLHLLDGALIQGSGSYSAFVDYIADLVTDYPDLFCTEADWQTSVTQYGACNKYVYDSVNNTVRIPKRNSEHGDLIKSYKSGADWYRIYSDGWCEQGGPGAYGNFTINFLVPFVDTNYDICAQALTNATSDNAVFASAIINKTSSSVLVRTRWSTSNTGDATCNCWYACGYVNISDYQYSPIYEYLVIATSTKTQIEVDIDEIATDLNGKADVDLTNVNNQGKILMSRMGMPSSSYDTLTLGASGTTYTAPANGWFFISKVAGGSGKYIRLGYSPTVISVQSHSSGSGDWLEIYLPVKKGDVVEITYSATGTTNSFRFVYAQGSEREA